MKLYLKFFAMHLKSQMAYRKSFFLSVVGQFLTSFTSFVTILFLFDRFETVRGYTLGECLLCAGVTLMSFALAECFFRGFDQFPKMVRGGDFDRVLLRPRSAVFLVLCEKMEFSRMGKLLQGIVMLALGIARAPVDWTPGRALVLAGMVAGGATVFASLFLLYAALCFFTLDGLEFMNIFTDGAREFAAYPLDIFGHTILTLGTFLVPYALFQYYPLLYLLGRLANPACALMPLLTPLFALVCYGIWRYGVRRYKSSGS